MTATSAESKAQAEAAKAEAVARIAELQVQWTAARAELQPKGVKFNMRVNHGVTHSVYINDPNGYGVEFLYELPREMWENDIDGAINWLEPLPSEGPEALAPGTARRRATRRRAPPSALRRQLGTRPSEG